jgi:hypothetical protein
MRILRIILLTIAVAISLSSNAQPTQNRQRPYGHFVGTIVAEWLPDGRRMKIVEGADYFDPTGQMWPTLKGAVVDGASIPQVAWSVIGGPFEGLYRNASVIHDIACDKKWRSWEATHHAFYLAMLASGVDPIKAKIMYGAVYHFGPRWPTMTTVAPSVPITEAADQAEELKKRLPQDRLVSVVVEPIQRVRPCSGCLAPMVLPVTHANIVATYLPPVRSLTDADFERLRKFVVETDPGVDDIQEFATNK